MPNGMPGHSAFRLTYATMFDPPPELHQKFDAALAKVMAELEGEYAMIIGGAERFAPAKIESRSPINRDWLRGLFQNGTAEDIDDAVRAAQAAQPAWAGLSWRERVKMLRRAAALIEERVFEIGAVLALEVGKNRMEALGEVQETADLITWYCDQMEKHTGYDIALPNDPLKGAISRNRSVLRPYGAWAVIAPFNFPFALTGGPAGAALVAGNTLVFKSASDTPWSGRLFAEVLRDAGLPEGVFNYVTGAGATAGEALIGHPGVAGVTFTGSFEVGMHIYRSFANGPYPRPCIAEMGGKNAAIVSRHADIERAALGILRSAFGLQGQKCSACSRIYVEKPVAAALKRRLVELIEAIRVGDPTSKESWLGPVINARSYAKYKDRLKALGRGAKLITGGVQLTEGDLEKGWFCAPTLAEAKLDHALWREEMFLPIALIAEVGSLEEAVRHANSVDYGLTAGFYGSREEVPWFLQHIEAGVTYSNRPQGATTGAWPGFQPFGGWKASGSTGKSAGSFYYLPQYLREQSQTVVD